MVNDVVYVFYFPYFGLSIIKFQIDSGNDDLFCNSLNSIVTNRYKAPEHLVCISQCSCVKVKDTFASKCGLQNVWKTSSNTLFW